MRERPILFSSEMVRAILEGRKTQTRRVVHGVDGSDKFLAFGIYGKALFTDNILNIVSGKPHDFLVKCPYGLPGDRLWVRETWAGDDWHGYAYKATDPDVLPFGEEVTFDKWRPSIYMPREASRTTLEIVSVRVERLQQIDNHESWREGIPEFGKWIENEGEARDEFARLWNSINAERGYGWDTNPWVWVIEFKQINQGVQDA